MGFNVLHHPKVGQILCFRLSVDNYPSVDFRSMSCQSWITPSMELDGMIFVYL
jgi:hypothetical protein